MVNRFSEFYGIRILLPHIQEPATFLYPERDESNPFALSHLLKIYFSIILPSPVFQVGLSGLPTKTFYATVLSPIRATCPAHLILLYLVARIKFGEDYRSLRSSLCSFLHSPVTSSFLGPNILLSTMFSKTLSLRSSLSMSDQVSHPYQTTSKIIVLYILILYVFGWQTGRQKILHRLIVSIT